MPIQAQLNADKIVTDYSGFIKDRSTGAILNSDPHALAAYKRRKNVDRTTQSQLKLLEFRLEQLSQQLTVMQSEFENLKTKKE